MKYFYQYLALFSLGLLLALSACTSFEVNSITITPPTGIIKVGQKLTITAIITLKNDDKDRILASVKDIIWTNTDESIAELSGVSEGIAEILEKRTGKVTITAEILGKKAGKVTIAAAYKANENAKASIEVTVLENGEVSSVEVKPLSNNIKVGETLQLTASVTGNNLSAGDKGVTWSSADGNVAKVDINGVVTGVGAGQTIVTATSDSDNTKSGTATVIVTNNKSVTSVIVAPTNAALKVGDTQAFTATVNGTNLDPADQTVTWSVADASIATVDQQGVVTGVTVTGGQTTVTATSNFDNSISGTATVLVTSNKIVTSVTVAPPTAAVKAGNTQTFTAAVNGANLDPADQTVTWSVTNASIATVDQQGVVTGVTGGQTTVTATSNFDNTKSHTAIVIVKSINSVIVDPTSVTMKVGDIQAFTTTVNGTNLDPADETVTWSVLDASIVTVDQQGVVTGVAGGETTVTATSDFDNSVLGTATVVVKSVSNVTLDLTNAVVKVGDTQAFTATVNGINLDPADQTVTWTTTDPNIATVDQQGIVTAVAGGQTTVTATAGFDSSTSGTATVVVKSVNSVLVDPTNVALKVGDTQAFAATVNGMNLDPVDEDVKWMVADESIATIDQQGVVTGLKEGATTIIATSDFDNTKSSTATIVVKSITNIAINPTNAVVKVGDTRTLTVTVDGKNLDPADKIIAWSVEDSSIATVDQQGVVTGVSGGQTKVIATSNFDSTKFGTVTIVVKSVNSVTVSPTNATLRLGDTQTFTAAINGTNLDLADQTVTWSVVNASIAIVDQQGVVTGVSGGQTTVTATSNFDNSVLGTATVVVKSVSNVTLDPTNAVVKVGDTQAFTATVNGINLDPADQTVTWTTTDPNIATVDQQGIVTAVAGGQTTVTATAGFDSSTSGTATVVVKSVNSVLVDPTNVALKVGDTQAFTATVNGTNLDPADQTVTWSVADASIATVDQQGVVTGVTVTGGQTTVTATSNFDNSISGTATVVVKSVNSVTVAPANAAVTIGNTQAFTATVTGTNLDPADEGVTWSIADTSIATVDTNGVVTGVAAGQTTVTATSNFDNSISGTAIVVVKSVTSVTVAPENAAVTIGNTQAFNATVTGTNLDPADEGVIWSIADTSIATVDTNGVVIGVDAGQTTVTATSDFDNSISGTATVTVNSNKSVTSVTVAPANAAVTIGNTQTFTATVTGTNLDPADEGVTWSIADTSIATVDTNGVVTGVDAGQTTVTATSDFDNSVSSTATVTVNSNKSVTSVDVQPEDPPFLFIGDTQTFTATVNGTNLDPADKTVTWSIADTSIATVDANGEVTAVGEGSTTVTATSDFDDTKFDSVTFFVGG